jgi:hypothetical protein
MAEKTHGVSLEVEQTKKTKAVAEVYSATFRAYTKELQGDFETRNLKFKAASWSRALATANLQLLPGERLFALELAE